MKHTFKAGYIDFYTGEFGKTVVVARTDILSTLKNYIESREIIKVSGVTLNEYIEDRLIASIFICYDKVTGIMIRDSSSILAGKIESILKLFNSYKYITLTTVLKQNCNNEIIIDGGDIKVVHRREQPRCRPKEIYCVEYRHSGKIFSGYTFDKTVVESLCRNYEVNKLGIYNEETEDLANMYRTLDDKLTLHITTSGIACYNSEWIKWYREMNRGSNNK